MVRELHSHYYLIAIRPLEAEWKMEKKRQF